MRLQIAAKQKHKNMLRLKLSSDTMYVLYNLHIHFQIRIQRKDIRTSIKITNPMSIIKGSHFSKHAEPTQFKSELSVILPRPGQQCFLEYSFKH